MTFGLVGFKDLAVHTDESRVDLTETLGDIWWCPGRSKKLQKILFQFLNSIRKSCEYLVTFHTTLFSVLINLILL